jgi:hypothetical protein
MGVLQFRNALCRNKEESLSKVSAGQDDNEERQRTAYAQRRELHVRRLTLGHFHHHDAKRPNLHIRTLAKSKRCLEELEAYVNTSAVIMASYQLGCHPAEGHKSFNYAIERSKPRVKTYQ